MITHIKSVHEEQYSDGSRTLGVLLNYSSEPQHEGWRESFIYMFRKNEEEDGRYIFFNTMFDMWSYILYSENKMKIAYMDEADFDKLYDAPFIDGTFSELLNWI